MIKIWKYKAGSAALALITACGGGGGGGSGVSDSNATVNISTGDYFTYAFNQKTTSGTTTAYTFTRYMSDVKADQSFMTVLTNSNDIGKSTWEANSDFQRVSWIGGSTSCNNSPQKDDPGSVKNLFVGMTWDLKYTTTCITSNTSTSYARTNKGTVVSSEPYIIAGVGSFDTYKLVSTYESVTSTERYVSQSTCWRDKKFNRTIACETTYSNYINGSSVPAASSSGTSSMKLYAFNVANFDNNKPSLARFSGNWTLNWSGDSYGYCSINVNIVGAISGNCYQQDPYATSSITGSVNVNGVLNITSGVGSTVSGNLNSPISGSGTWRNPTTSGSWTAVHL